MRQEKGDRHHKKKPLMDADEDGLARMKNRVVLRTSAQYQRNPRLKNRRFLLRSLRLCERNIQMGLFPVVPVPLREVYRSDAILEGCVFK